MLNRPDATSKSAADEGVTLRDFYSILPSHSYIFLPTGERWAASSINSRIYPVPLLDAEGVPVLNDKGKPVMIAPTDWLDRHRAVEQMAWAPGRPQEIENYLISDGGWIYRKDVSTLNLYRPPILKHGDPNGAGKWLDLLGKVFPADGDLDHILNYFAHRVQRPGEKINHALLFGGDPGVGKDTIIEPLKRAVGAWNCKEVSPREMFETYNDYMKAVLLRISEARDLGEVNRYAFYDALKTVTAAPPDTVRVNAKYIPQHYALNVCGVILTTNYKTNGIYLPPDDRRTYVAWSPLKKDDFEDGYFVKLWDWYFKEGIEHVAAALAKRDISKFDPKAPPKKTEAFWAIVDANMAPEQSELEDTLDEMRATGNRRIDAITLIIVIGYAEAQFQEWLQDRRNRRMIPHRFEESGYVPVRSKTKDGLWVHNKRRQVIYAKAELSLKERFEAAERLISRGLE